MAILVLIISDLIVVLLLVNPILLPLLFYSLTLLKTTSLQLCIAPFDYVCYMYHCYISNCEHSDITFLIFHS